MQKGVKRHVQKELTKEEMRVLLDIVTTELNNVKVALAHMTAIRATDNDTYRMFKQKEITLKGIIKKL